MSSNLASDDIAQALAAFLYGGAGPRHVDISRVLTSAGLSDDYVYTEGGGGTNKEQRVLNAFTRARHQGDSRKLVEGLLSALRHMDLIGQPENNRSEQENRLRLALGRTGWFLTNDGQLRPFAGVDLDTGGREALDEQLQRLRASTTDPALLIGTAKDLLEAVAKFVLEELGMSMSTKSDFNALWYIARERLGILPDRVDPNLPGHKEIRAIHQSTWAIAENVNNLRNLQGTGHGRTLPTGVSEDMALFVVREACTVADYMLRQLDRQRGG